MVTVYEHFHIFGPFTKRENFCDFLFAALEDMALHKNGSTLIEKMFHGHEISCFMGMKVSQYSCQVGLVCHFPKKPKEQNKEMYVFKIFNFLVYYSFSCCKIILLQPISRGIKCIFSPFNTYCLIPKGSNFCNVKPDVSLK